MATGSAAALRHRNSESCYRAVHDTLLREMLQSEARQNEGGDGKRQAVDAYRRCDEIARQVGSSP